MTTYPNAWFSPLVTRLALPAAIPATRLSHGLHRSGQSARAMTHGYDQSLFTELVDDYYGGSDFANWGYWRPNTRTQKQACENLMEELLSFVPVKRGAVLDVACGKGATTRHLLRYWSPRRVTGINISEKQLERARRNAPGARFLFMDATRLRFDDESFDTVICVEAAFHFDTRERFFREAQRVLRPGGRLVLSDVLFTYFAESLAPTLNVRNWLPDVGAYRRLLESAGFGHVRIVDATEECWARHDRYRAEWVQRKYLAGELGPGMYLMFSHRRGRRRAGVRNYLLVSAQKPIRSAGRR